jgi:hypothetical protein
MYYNYGARGIKLIAEWNNFQTFAKWAIANGFQENLTLDRVDNEGDYCPSNCRWVDDLTQKNNRRDNRPIEWKGKKYNSLANFVRSRYYPSQSEIHTENHKEFKKTYQFFNQRFNKGWKVERIVDRYDQSMQYGTICNRQGGGKPVTYGGVRYHNVNDFVRRYWEFMPQDNDHNCKDFKRVSQSISRAVRLGKDLETVVESALSRVPRQN